VTGLARRHDIVLYGATGFVGRLLAEYLAGHATPETRIALAGRSGPRLEDVRSGLPDRAADWPIIVADAADTMALQEIAASTRVVATTVGPYARFGLPLARACAEAGTHYADLAGEVLFVRDLMDRVEETARRTGARLVTACGYDSVPSDLGVLMLHERAVADGAGGLTDTTLIARAKGGFSGGTIESGRAQLDTIAADPTKRKILFDAYSLSPERALEPDVGPQRDPKSVFVERETREWVGPFIMAPFNSRIVRRSNALQDHAYGRHFRYREVSGYGAGARGRVLATAVTGGLGLVMAGLRTPVVRPLFDGVLPSPGQGPDEETQRTGRFRMEIRTITESGRRYLAVVAAKGDPGYAATAVMLGESALCLAADGDRLPARAGVLTPATAMGDVLVDRLRAQGFTMSVEEL
jgi:short subunit dehydrogenase-like uncharacterized protein